MRNIEEDATIEEMDLIARAVELTERLRVMNEARTDTDTYILYGPYPDPVEVKLTILEFLDFYQNDIFVYDFDGAPAQIHTGHVSSIVLKKPEPITKPNGFTTVE